MERIEDIICCPYCQADLEYKTNFLYCKTCDRKYKIKDNIIVLISKELEEELRN